MSISAKMAKFVENGATIRRMFEEGARMKALHGPSNVFDFSIGNPDLPPPEAFARRLESLARETPAGLHGYLPNAGLPAARRALALRASAEQGIEIGASHIVVTCGASGGLNIVCKALFEPGDEMLVSSPYFVDYGFIADNHGGRLVSVSCRTDFSLDVPALEAAMNPRTKILLINTPHNPTGKVYDADSLRRLALALQRKCAEFGHAIYLVSDEPYRALAYDCIRVPGTVSFYPHSLVVTSHSKDLSLPGERIGYVAVNPKAEDADRLVEALTLANRILGFVNAPSLMQHIIAALPIDLAVDSGRYERRRNIFAAGLKAAGYEFSLPEGAFYFFIKTPGEKSDAEFVEMLRDEKILVVPGGAFGAPGYFRIAFCVEESVIENSLPGFARALERATGNPVSR